MCEICGLCLVWRLNDTTDIEREYYTIYMFIKDYYYYYIFAAANFPMQPFEAKQNVFRFFFFWSNLISFLPAVVFSSCPYPLVFLLLGQHLNFVWQSFVGGGRQNFFGRRRCFPVRPLFFYWFYPAQLLLFCALFLFLLLFADIKSAKLW